MNFDAETYKIDEKKNKQMNERPNGNKEEKSAFNNVNIVFGKSC